MNKKLNVTVTYLYEIEVDENNAIVKEYADLKELVEDLASYRFTILPVIGDGVVIKDVELIESDYETA